MMSRSPMSVLEHSVGNADAQIDDPAVLELQRDAIGHLLAGQSLGVAHRRRSCRRLGQMPSGGGGTCTRRCTKMPDVCTMSGSMLAGGHDRFVDLGDGDARGGRHHRIEISLRTMELQIAESVGAGGAHEGVVERQGVFQQVLAAVDHARLAALGEFGADRGGCVERRDAGTRGAQPFRQRALRHQLGIDLAGFVIFGERQHVGRTRGGGEGADHLLHLAVLHQHADVGHCAAAARRRWCWRPASAALRPCSSSALIRLIRHARHGKAAESR